MRGPIVKPTQGFLISATTPNRKVSQMRRETHRSRANASAMTNHLRLHYAPDNASLCVRLALLQLGLPFETVLVDRGQRAQKDAAYMALNPNGLIPTLETKQGPIFETAAILLWLADSHPSENFPQARDASRGPALSWLFWLANTLHPTLRMAFYADRFAKDVTQLRTRSRLQSQLAILENSATALQNAPLLQCYAMPMLRWMSLYGQPETHVQLTGYPALFTIAKEFETTDIVRDAIKAEGLGPEPFTRPHLPNPPEGRAL